MMARFTQPFPASYASTEESTWEIEGGTTGAGAVQPTFDGAPLFTGEWYKLGNLVHFAIDVDMDNITSFGSGQYYVKLPFPAGRNYLLSDGCLHDTSTGDEYAILGHVVAGSDILTLLATISNGKQVPFTNSVPVNLSTADNFHVAGTYVLDDSI
jgi:hypothetical protein